MMPLHLLVHSADPEAAARIVQALRAGAPESTVEIVADAAALVRGAAAGTALVSADHAAAPEGEPPPIAPALRHELNNHLALIRMLADLLAESHSAPPFFTAKAQEIGQAAEAAAQALRRTKASAG